MTTSQRETLDLELPTRKGPTEVPARSALEEGFPGLMLSHVGTKESWRKEVHRPATSTHKWWAKRLGTVFRGIIASASASSTAEALDAYNSRTSLNGLTIFDPFAGSGTTVVESLKFGATAVGFDINPVATLVQRQAIQRWDWETLEKLYSTVEAQVREEIDRVHRDQEGRTVLYYFWATKVDCLTCNEPTHLFDSPVYSKHVSGGAGRALRVVCPHCLSLSEQRGAFEAFRCTCGEWVDKRGPVHGPKVRCRHGHENNVIDSLGGNLPERVMYAKMVVDSAGAKAYEPITDWDRNLYGECEERLASLPDGSILPQGSLEPGNNTVQAMRWNYRRWADFFNARQLYSLSLLATALRDLPECPEREALVALFSGTLEFNNMFTSFKGEGTGAVRHMFSHHILKPQRTPLEAHPWGHPKSSGSFSTFKKSRLSRAHDYKNEPADLVERRGKVERTVGISCPVSGPVAMSWTELESTDARAYVRTGNSAATDLPSASVDMVITDPPYMDNVHYAELADFFHAWLRQMDPFDGYSAAESTRSDGEVQDADPAAFGKAISGVWKECSRVLKPEGIVAFTFHQARVAGWVELIEALKAAGLTVTAVQPVTGEMSTSVVKAGAREPSSLDSVVVCRKTSHVGAKYHASAEEALSAASARLSNLIEGGVTVGAGDVRSVVRGTMLSYFSASEGPLSSYVEMVDGMADDVIRETLFSKTTV
ncbi:hypothetical protein [Micrococcus aloeverae]|uniref:hypothetical protein n=1 Tax=Micrococcus aloeverae TaxID=1391911 RepID=UPI001AD802C6|nr:hypothetical protein [Micrococcus aloeverae]